MKNAGLLTEGVFGYAEETHTIALPPILSVVIRLKIGMKNAGLLTEGVFGYAEGIKPSYSPNIQLDLAVPLKAEPDSIRIIYSSTSLFAVLRPFQPIDER